MLYLILCLFCLGLGVLLGVLNQNKHVCALVPGILILLLTLYGGRSNLSSSLLLGVAIFSMIAMLLGHIGYLLQRKFLA